MKYLHNIETSQLICSANQLTVSIRCKIFRTYSFAKDFLLRNSSCDNVTADINLKDLSLVLEVFTLTYFMSLVSGFHLFSGGIERDQ